MLNKINRTAENNGMKINSSKIKENCKKTRRQGPKINMLMEDETIE